MYAYSAYSNIAGQYAERRIDYMPKVYFYRDSYERAKADKRLDLWRDSNNANKDFAKSFNNKKPVWQWRPATPNG